MLPTIDQAAEKLHGMIRLPGSQFSVWSWEDGDKSRLILRVDPEALREGFSYPTEVDGYPVILDRRTRNQLLKLTENA